jgi:hypothetical protein
MNTGNNKYDHCPNCGFDLLQHENFCPKCGQKNHDLKVPLKHVIEEVFENTLHLDSKVFRTIKFLVFKPGYLSLEFNSGKRVNYVPPIRLYVLISFLFFFLLSLVSVGHKNSAETNREINKGNKKPGTEITYNGINSSELIGLTIAQTDSLMRARKVPNTNINRFIFYKLNNFANSGAAEFSHLLMKNISYMMFILMPLFGVWIFLFNRKKLGYFLEALIVYIHFHCFVFLMFTFLVLIGLVISNEIPLLLGFLIIPVYMFLMLKNAVKQSLGLTIVKTGAIGILYLGSLIELMFLTMAVSILFI